MTVLFATHPAYLEHVAGSRHPERPERLAAVLDGIRNAGIGEALMEVEPQPATQDDLTRVHPLSHLQRIESLSAAGGGRLDPDTSANAHTWDAARLAAGAGLTMVQQLRAGRGDVGFCAVRPPGHHATRAASMGFCIISNIAVTAASLADAGERVLILDIDAHHGNGTQDVFYDDPRVLFVSLHQWPLYPGSGAVHETGVGAGEGSTMNIPLPPGSTGDVYLRAFDELVAPLAARFGPTWVLISAGFDAHRDDPITSLGLTAGDYPPLVERAFALVPAGRRLAMLEGGYDLDALALCAGATMQQLAGAAVVLPDRERATSNPSSDGAGRGHGGAAVDAVAAHWATRFPGWLS